MAHAAVPAIAIVILTFVGCSPALPTPVLARHPRSDYQPVPYPPPAAFSEVVPERPRPAAVWIDGHWAWQSGGFFWERGGWLLAPPGARFAPWRLRYAPDGTLLFAEDSWYGADLRPIPTPQLLLPAITPSNELTPESEHGF